MSKRKIQDLQDAELPPIETKRRNQHSRSPQKIPTQDQYGVGWLCALPKEQTAARGMLDERYPDPPKPQGDHNAYTLGSIGDHNVVIACLPKGKLGTNAAASSATQMVRTFPSIKVVLMVGIGGGNPLNGVRLGDVVISAPIDQYPGVVQWDMGKVEANGIFKRTGALNNPPNALLTAVAKLESDHEMEGSQIPKYLNALGKRYPRLASKYTWSNALKDPLATQNSTTNSIPNTADADFDKIGRRPDEPWVHYGLIASGNQVVKDATVRDQLNKSFGGHVLCIEMEAAGLMDNFPCIVIRGICDYADAQKNKEWQEYAAAVAAACAKELLEFVEPLDVDGERPMKEILDDVQGSVRRTEKDVKFMTSAFHKKEEFEVLDWLTKTDYGPQQSDILRMREPETCQWFLDSSQYHNWRSSSQQTLFCVGDPGVGKTILIATVVDDLTTRVVHDQSIGVAYLYINFKRHNEQQVDDLLASLLKQLSQGRPLPDSVTNLYNLHKTNRTRPSLDQILQTLLSVAALYSKVFVIVDALDECQTSNGSLSTFLDKLFALQSQPMINLLATSRRIPDIQMRFEGCMSQDISASDGDIRKYLGTHMTRLPRCVAESPQLQEEVKAKIAKAVDGSFLLARLHLESLVGMRSPKAIRIGLDKLPQGSDAYDPAYEEAMHRIRGQVHMSQELAEQTLTWIVCAKRQLSVLALQHALAVEVGASDFDEENISRVEDILSVCAGLVTVDKESNVIRLVHYTTQEYFERKRDYWFPEANQYLTETCVTYLLFDFIPRGQSLCDRYSESYSEAPPEFFHLRNALPFYVYSACHWGDHARESSILHASVMKFLNCYRKLELSLRVYARYSFRARMNIKPVAEDLQSTGLRLAVYFGVVKAVEHLIDRDADLESRNRRGCTVLFLAIEGDWHGVVKLLVEKGANVNSRDKNERTPLLWAAQMGSVEGIKLLLEKGADVNSRDKDGRTPLLGAAQMGSVEGIKLLLEKGADPNSRDSTGQAALLGAALIGKPEVVKLLLEKGADPNPRDSTGRTPLLRPELMDKPEVVKLLLEKGADPNPGDSTGRTPLLRAVRMGKSEVVKLLLEKGADPDLRDSTGQTPLLRAVLMGKTEVVKFLLEKGFDVESPDQDGRTPLSWAAEVMENNEVVELLLAKGANLEAQDKHGRTPLSWAAWWPNMAVVQLLLENGAHPNL